MGKNLKPVPEGNKGLKKLPTEVRNKMGFMKKGGQVAGPKGYTKKKKPKSFAELVYSSGDGSEYQKDKVTKSGKRLGGFEKGGQVAGLKGYRRKPKKEVQSDAYKPYKPLPYIIPEGKKGDAIRAMFLNRKNIEKKNKGGLVKGGTSAQMTGKEYKGTF